MINMSSISKTLLLLTVSFSLAACSAGIKSIPANYVPNEKDVGNAIAILKVTPKTAEFASSTLTFRRMGLKGDTIYYRKLLGDDTSSSSATPNADYYVFSVEPVDNREVHAISVLEEHSKKEPTKKRVGYTPGCAGYALGFRIQAPGVYYLGDLTYGEEVTRIGELKFSYDIKSDLQSVQAYLAKNYPALAESQIKQKALEKFWFNAQCQPATIYISM